MKIAHTDIQPLLDKKAFIDKKNEKNKREAREQREKLHMDSVAYNAEQVALGTRRDYQGVALERLKDKQAVFEDKFESIEVDLMACADDLYLAELEIIKNIEELKAMPVPKPLVDTDFPLPKYIEYDTAHLIETIEKAEANNKLADMWDAIEMLDGLI